VLVQYIYLLSGGAMVSKYQRKSDQQSWDPQAMQRAIDAVNNEGMKWNTAAKTFNVPRNTLKRRVLKKNLQATDTKKILGHYRAVFNEAQEDELKKHLLDMEVRFFGIRIPDLRSLAYQLAEENNIPHNFNHETKLAGKDWVRGFRKRHPELVLREPEKTSAARAQAFNQVNVNKFYDMLEDVQKTHLYPPHRVFNVDETGLMTVQSKTSKVFALKGRRQVGSLTSAERGVLSTFAVCMSAGGTFIPPFIIFPRQRMKAELQDGAPPGTAFACHTSGWMQSEIFTQWFDHFLKFAKPSKEDPVLLILDGHATHTKNLDFIEKARNNYTTVVCIPPHCSHKMQPLDVSFMGPFNTYYVQAIERFLRNNPGRLVTQYQVSRLLGEAFLLAATPTIAVKGFRKCGIVPINRNVFTELDFAPATTTEIPNPITSPSEDHQQESRGQQNSHAETVLPRPSTSSAMISLPMPNKPTSTPVSQPTKENVPVAPADTTTPSTSTSDSTSFVMPCTSFSVSPQSIIPIPKVNIVKRQTKRKKGSATVLTSSPYKAELVAAKEEKEEKERQKKIKLELKKEKGVVKKQQNRKQVCEKTKTKPVYQKLFRDSDSDTSDVDCLFCGSYFSKSKDKEGWIRCSGCHQWAHEACAGCEEDDDDFVCDICKNF